MPRLRVLAAVTCVAIVAALTVAVIRREMRAGTSSGPDVVVSVGTFGYGILTSAGFVPDVIVYADGTVLHHVGRLDDAVPMLTIAHLEPAAVAEVRRLTATLRAIPEDLGAPPVADVPTTRIEFRVGGRTVARSATGLGFAWPTAPAALRDGRATMGVVVDALARLGTDGAPWAPPAIEIRPIATGRIEAATGDWPVGSVDLASLGCAVVEGDDVAALLAALPSGVRLPAWSQRGRTHVVRFTPVLPGRVGCASGG